MNALAYIRVSGASQVDKDGPERQVHTISDFARSRKLTLAIDPAAHLDLRDYPFFDAGVSGTKDSSDRPGLNAAIEYCHEHGIHTLLVEKTDRLSRDLVVGFSIIARCQSLGIRVIDCSTGIELTETSDPYAKFILQVVLAAAELNKNIFVHQSKQARTRLRLRNGRCEGQKSYRDLPQHAPAVARIDELHAQRLTSREIAHTLNAEGFHTKYGNPWSHGTVCKIINQRNAG